MASTLDHSALALIGGELSGWINQEQTDVQIRLSFGRHLGFKGDTLDANGNLFRPIEHLHQLDTGEQHGGACVRLVHLGYVVAIF